MKSIRFFLVSLLTVFAVSEIQACWEPGYSPSAYYMYRVYDGKSDSENDEYYISSRRNCEEWQNYTSKEIIIEDIYDVVYEMSLDEFEKVYNNPKATYKNRFLEWMTKVDTDILDFFLLAKTNEYVRFQHNSRWYYPSMKIGARMTLEDIAETALASKNERLRDRYLLQAVRALFSLARYKECVELWENEVVKLPQNNIMRRMIAPYVAGAKSRVGRAEEAYVYFAQIGDVESMYYCAGMVGEKLSPIDMLELVCQYAPNSNYIAEALQAFVRSLEPDGSYCVWSNEETYKDTTESEKLYSLCLKMGRNRKCDNPAMWYYTAAFLADLKNEPSQASYLLRLAENSRSSDYINESIKVLRIYLDAKLSTYNSAYENKLFGQLKWLDNKIANNIDEDVRRETSHESWKMKWGMSYYYWNDMMRRILLAEVCPRVLKAGKTTRALQLANMADNRLLNLVGSQECWVTDPDSENHWEGKYVELSMHDYRYLGEDNFIDYSNHFFEMIDSIGVNNAIQYVQRVKHPQTEFDRFLNARGYTGSDYLNDIVGTQCLRNMRYADAVRYLGAVSIAYKKYLNTYMNYDPFSAKSTAIKNAQDFKYNFAREMRSLEKDMEQVTEPNRKAMLMVRYAVGIKNSFGRCWGLTQYYLGDTYAGQVCEKRDWQHDEYTQAAVKKADKMIYSALEMVTDAEMAAEIHYAFCNFKTVADNFPDTKKGVLVKGACDNLHDHHALNINPQSWKKQFQKLK